MKVKNIAFSGFAAMILAGVCGVADAASASVNLASKSYVDAQLEGKADLIDLETLETTVGQKATQESLEIVATQVNTNTIDIAALKAAGYVSDDDLAEVQRTLQAAIDEKQAKGEYAAAEALQTVSTELATLKGGVYTKDEIDKKITDAISGGQIDLSGYATTSALDALTLLVNGNTTEINALKNAGYQTSSQVQGAITTAVADLATKAELNAKQDKLTPGTNITIADGTISADIDLSGLATEQALTNLQTTLEAAIAEKQAKGEYLVAADLTDLNNAISALQTGKADKSTVETIQTTINNLGNTYATKSDMTTADTALQNAIDAIEIPSLAEYAKTADVDAKLALKADATALTGLVTSTQLSELRTALETEIAKKQNSGDYATAEALQTISTELGTLKGDVYTKAQVDAKIAEAATGGEIDLSGYATTSALDALTALVNGNTTEINALKNAGYQTSTQVSEAISTATATLATKDELNTKQDTLTAGTNIEIVDNIISATIDTSSLVKNPTLPTEKGDYMLMVGLENGTYTYTWTNIEDYHPSDTDTDLWN